MSSPPPYPPMPPQQVPVIPTGPDGRPARPGLVTAIAVVDFVAAFLFGSVALVYVVLGLTATGEEALALRLGSGALLVIFGVLAVGCLVAGVGMLRMAPWGRVVQIIVSCFGLLFCGLGTLINALILVYLASKKTSILFSGRRVDELRPDELMHVTAPRSSNPAIIAIAIVIGFFAMIGVMGILAAIAIPNFITAEQRAKQKRTVSDVRLIGSALEAYSTDNSAYPAVGTMDELKAAVVPTYAKTLPDQDAWQHAYEVATAPEQGYVVRSAGKDGTFEQPDPWAYQPGTISTFDGDIVYANGQLIRGPEGSSVASAP